MSSPELLRARLAAIGESLERSGQALALIGLGSVGLELERLDEHSDLDFFVVVEPGRKALFLDDLDWLRAIAPVAYSYRNTVDGHKLLYADGVFCEFAVFTPDELRRVPFAPGRIVWRRPGVGDEIAVPVTRSPAAAPASNEWLLGEALSNLYVGLGRFRRGERLAAARLIQFHAVDRVLELAARREPEQAARRDPFAPERRLEQRLPQVARELPTFLPGYERSPAAARAMLDYLEREFEVDAAMAAAIRRLCDGAQ